MKFHNYLELVVGNKLNVKLLRTMLKFSGKIFTIRSLARTAEVSHNDAALRIHELDELGIIKFQPVGRAYQLHLNENNYILKKIIKPMFAAESSTYNELIKVLKKHLTRKEIISAALFGSVSKSEEQTDSDVDLLIISDDFDAANFAATESAEETLEVFYSKISTIIFTKKDFLSKKNSTLVHSILSNYTMICGKDLEGFIK